MTYDLKIVSIVVPIFNTEHYISRCIESILSQTYSNIELILINDGSIDRSAEICFKYAELDKRIIFIDKENEGVSSTRNRGIEIASGEYIAFVDSDDYIADNFVEILLNAIEKNGADLAICNYKRFFNNGVEINSGFDCPNRILDTKESLDYFVFNNSEFVLTAVVRLYSLEIIKTHHIRFYEDMWYGEDYIFQLEYAFKTKKVSLLLSEVLYFRAEENPYSLSKSSSALLWETQDKINRRLYSATKKYEYLSKVVALDCIGRLTQTVYGLIIDSKNYKSFIMKSQNFFNRSEIKEVLKDISSIFPQNSNVKFLNAIYAGSNSYFYYRQSIYFKIRFFMKRCYIGYRGIKEINKK